METDLNGVSDYTLPLFLYHHYTPPFFFIVTTHYLFFCTTTFFLYNHNTLPLFLYHDYTLPLFMYHDYTHLFYVSRLNTSSFLCYDYTLPLSLVSAKLRRHPGIHVPDHCEEPGDRSGSRPVVVRNTAVSGYALHYLFWSCFL